MKRFKSHFKFTKQERSGIFFLLSIIVLLQIGYFAFQYFPLEDKESLTVDSETQTQIDILKASSAAKDIQKMYPFNPNFITDYKGYTLGMSVAEIDRLHAYRAKNKFVNSIEEFQKVTEVPDSLLGVISPFFKFPEWTRKNKPSLANDEESKVDRSSSVHKGVSGSSVGDLNLVTAEELKKINGIGEVLSARIVKFRDRLGGFLIDEQLYDVYGLEPDVAKRTLAHFKVIVPPEIKKISVTWASYNELRNILYINDKFANSIIEYRKFNTIISLTELKSLDGFPEGRFERIELYLSL
ncbi:helix-hairpin-helix domain-containing protein [Aggregatimonas sangjinii]|uniref:Helix-hairpin-helix domain-containing protein n=1 Tax=Aggregatimonas sangjinii TaxID=2583587 RepID=A0A5B7SL04_9FLAO|nr:helix-hairpin-helix domain-containing protein [Aggregatimonas sangjinii]QCW99224.1 helix-hairpin-helix domain-containing protein [Aggregatimonas sangjinii]